MRRIILGLSLTATLITQDAYGQANALFERANTPSGAVVDTGALAITGEPIGEGDYDEDRVANEVFAAAASVAHSATGSAFADAQVAGEASTLTTIGATTGVPQVEADMVLELLAGNDEDLGITGLAYGSWSELNPDYDMIDSQAVATADYEIGGDDAQYLLNGTLHLAAVGVLMGNADLNQPTPTDPGTRLTASIGPFFVQAEWQGNGIWQITGQLPDNITIDETTTGLNNYYNFSIPVADGAQTAFLSSVELREGAYAFGLNDAPPSSINYIFSASAWAVATGLGDSPVLGDVDGDGDVDIQDWQVVIQGGDLPFPVTLARGDTNQDGIVDVTDFQNIVANLPGLPGDFDGDLDIDGGDFLAWQRGNGIASGATISDGDADFNGTVDAADLALWQLGFGVVLPSPITAIPEPTSLALLTGLLPLAYIARRSK